LGFERGARERRGSSTCRLTLDSPLLTCAHPALTLHSPSLRVGAGKSGVTWVRKSELAAVFCSLLLPRNTQNQGVTRNGLPRRSFPKVDFTSSDNYTIDSLVTLYSFFDQCQHFLWSHPTSFCYLIDSPLLCSAQLLELSSGPRRALLLLVGPFPDDDS
jgi:hypothetical protein